VPRDRQTDRKTNVLQTDTTENNATFDARVVTECPHECVLQIHAGSQPDTIARVSLRERPIFRALIFRIMT